MKRSETKPTHPARRKGPAWTLVVLLVTTAGLTAFPGTHAHVVETPTIFASQGAVDVPLADPAQVGRWLAPFEGEEPGVFMALVPSGEVLYWSYDRTRVVDLSGEAPHVYAPSPEWPGELFDGSSGLLPDGHILVAGGMKQSNIDFPVGEIPLNVTSQDRAFLFDSATATFRETGSMHAARLAPGLVRLHDGTILAVSGSPDLLGQETAETPERYDPANGEWTLLPASADNLIPLWPRMFQVPSGPFAGDVVYVPGGCTQCNIVTHPDWHHVQTLDLETMEWTVHAQATAQARNFGSSVMLMLQPEDDWRARVLSIGGGIHADVVLLPGAASQQAELIDLSTAPPAVTLVSPMEHPRWYPTAILLPTGEILAMNGAMTGNWWDVGIVPVMTPELYDPHAVDPVTGLTGSWRTLAEMHVPRGDHSAALLLPDGRVLAGGHVPHFPRGDVPEIDHISETRLEIFEPPYLFRGPRPVIEQAPETIGHDEVFTVTTPHAPIVTRGVLMGLGTSTHAFDHSQRGIELELVSTAETAMEFRAPPDAFIAPPGHYMLFLLADHGEGEVPSVAKFLRISAEAAAIDDEGHPTPQGLPGPPVLVVLFALALLGVRLARERSATPSHLRR